MRKSKLFILEVILICLTMILEGSSLSEDLQSLKLSLLRKFLDTSVLVKFLVDISWRFARHSEDTMQIEFTESQLIGGQETLFSWKLETLARD